MNKNYLSFTSTQRIKFSKFVSFLFFVVVSFLCFDLHNQSAFALTDSEIQSAVSGSTVEIEKFFQSVQGNPNHQIMVIEHLIKNVTRHYIGIDYTHVVKIFLKVYLAGIQEGNTAEQKTSDDLEKLKMKLVDLLEKVLFEKGVSVRSVAPESLNLDRMSKLMAETFEHATRWGEDHERVRILDIFLNSSESRPDAPGETWAFFKALGLISDYPTIPHDNKYAKLSAKRARFLAYSLHPNRIHLVDPDTRGELSTDLVARFNTKVFDFMSDDREFANHQEWLRQVVKILPHILFRSAFIPGNSAMGIINVLSGHDWREVSSFSRLAYRPSRQWVQAFQDQLSLFPIRILRYQERDHVYFDSINVDHPRGYSPDFYKLTDESEAGAQALLMILFGYPYIPGSNAIQLPKEILNNVQNSAQLIRSLFSRELAYPILVGAKLVTADDTVDFLQMIERDFQEYIELRTNNNMERTTGLLRNSIIKNIQLLANLNTKYRALLNDFANSLNNVWKNRVNIYDPSAFPENWRTEVAGLKQTINSFRIALPDIFPMTKVSTERKSFKDRIRKIIGKCIGVTTGG